MIKLTVFTILRRIVQWCSGYLHCCETDLHNLFIFQNQNSMPTEQQLPFPLPPALQLCSLPSLHLPALDTVYKWNHTVLSM